MKINEFLARLQGKLSGLPREDVEKTVAYYREIIEDRMEEGLSEEAAVEAVGSIDEISSQIWEDASPSGSAKTKAASRRRLKTWEIVCLVLGAPIWLSLLIAAVAVVASVYISLGAVLFVFYLLVILFGALAFAFVASAVFCVIAKEFAQAVLLTGCGLIFVGFTILSVLLSRLMTKGTVWLSKLVWTGIKRCIAGRELA